VLHELAHLAAVYDTRFFIMTDTMLDVRYFEPLLRALKRQQAPYHLFFQTTSMLTEPQVKLLAEAGVFWIQPGIESLHDDLLRLLNKGNPRFTISRC